MFIRIKSTAKPDKKKVQICESVREGDKIKQVIVRHVGIAHDEQELETLKRLAVKLIVKIDEDRTGPYLFPMDEIEEKVRHITKKNSPVVATPVEPVKLELETLWHTVKRGKEKIKKIGSGKNAKKLVGNRGYQKYLKVEGERKILLDNEKLAEDEKWDGLHGIITNDKASKAVELLGFYRRLWVIEESFRIHKTDLALRPVYHFKPERVQAHILFCYIAFALMSYAEYRIGVQKEPLSWQEIRKALWRTQSSILTDHKTGKLYRIPSKAHNAAKAIYQTFGLARNERITELKESQ